jgi:hypothetical protein
MTANAAVIAQTEYTGLLILCTCMPHLQISLILLLPCCSLRVTYPYNPSAKSNLAHRLVTSRAWTFRPCEQQMNRFSRNVGNQIPSDAASHPRKTEISSIPLRKPENSQWFYAVSLIFSAGNPVLNRELLGKRKPGKRSRYNVYV